MEYWNSGLRLGEPTDRREKWNEIPKATKPIPDSQYPIPANWASLKQG